MGSGKSTVGRLLARDLGRPFVDLDHEIEVRAGQTILEIFAEHGEARFRDLERATLADVLAGDHVVACGGGTVTHPESRKLLGSATTIFLEEDLEVLYGRTRSSGRPLRGAGREEFARRYAERLPLYRQVADHVVAVNGRPQRLVAGKVARWLKV